jgi:hypothetical protein
MDGFSFGIVPFVPPVDWFAPSEPLLKCAAIDPVDFELICMSGWSDVSIGFALCVFTALTALNRFVETAAMKAKKERVMRVTDKEINGISL